MSQELAFLQKRIRSLEIRARRSRFVLLSLFAFLSLSLLISWQESKPAPKRMRASSFELVDAKGRVRGKWSFEKNRDPSFVLLDAKGRKRFEATLVDDDEVYLKMRDRKGHGRLTEVVDRAGNPQILLHDPGNKPRLQMAVAPTGASSLIFITADGEMPAGIGAHADGEPWLLPKKQ